VHGVFYGETKVGPSVAIREEHAQSPQSQGLEENGSQGELEKVFVELMVTRMGLRYNSSSARPSMVVTWMGSGERGWGGGMVGEREEREEK
jgi:hypothetical protein